MKESVSEAASKGIDIDVGSIDARGIDSEKTAISGGAVWMSF